MSDRDRVTDRDQNLLADLQQRFATIAGDDRQIDPDELQTALRIKDPYYARKVFAIFDADGSGLVSSSEFLTAVEALIQGGQETKLRFVFQLHDNDRSGLISREELRTIFDASLNENQLRFASEDIDALVTALFEETDMNADGQISLDEFKATVERYPQICRHMTLNAAAWLQPPAEQESAPSAWSVLAERLHRAWHYLQNNWTKLLFLAIYLGVNSWLFANAVQKYAATGANVYVQLARGCGACLNFNGALILIPMLRQWLTWLRQTVVNNILPLDESIEFHKLVGHVMFGFSLVHTGAHVLNYTTLTVPFTSSLFGTKAGLTGFFLLLVFIVMWVCALDRIRRQGHFELFYITHWGFVAWFALALVHGPVFWQWTILPIVGYIIERLLRFSKGYEPTYVTNVSLLPSQVTHLEMHRP
ncbi:MAG: ferric reductase-like transmembrane domain-containing protein, partial [Candidatus Tectomicrobia bacterium]|nr:ferric reductase-like transmembrane domain-containing protein [Candidatus Tectomicrobia bacterium]